MNIHVFKIVTQSLRHAIHSNLRLLLLGKNRILRIRLELIHLQGKLAFSITSSSSRRRIVFGVTSCIILFWRRDSFVGHQMTLNYCRCFRVLVNDPSLTNCSVDRSTVKYSVPEGPHLSFGVLVSVLVVLQEVHFELLQMLSDLSFPLKHFLKELRRKISKLGILFS